MTFFKIIQNEKVVNIGCVFLKWNEKRKKLYVCDVDDAQFVQTFDESNIYTASWLNPPPKEAGEFESAEVVVIDEAEFDELRELLSEGEEIVVEQPAEQYVMPVTPAEQPEEKPMTIAEMREIIIKQQEQIETLLKMFQN